MEINLSNEVSVVIPASGTGDRMCIPIPKQYCDVLGKPLLLFCVEAFHKVEWIRQIIVAVDKAHEDFVKDLMSEHALDKVTVVSGGATRHRSIYAGIKAITNVSLSDVVLIHDAVRPIAELQVIRQVTDAARTYGAAGVVRPLVSTVISEDQDGFLKESLDRSQYRASEMPQGFQFNLIKTAYEKSTDYDFDFGTECLHLVQKYTGTKVKLIQGPDSLWKVTHKKDLYAAEGILRENLIHTCVIGISDMSLKDQISDYFTENFIKVSFAPCHSDLPSNVTDVIKIVSASEENNCEDIVSSVPALITQLTGVNTPVIITPVLVLVIMYSDNVDLYKQQTEIHKILSSRSDGMKSVWLSAVVTKAGNDKRKLFDLLKHIVRERGGALSGHVMIL